MSLKKGHKFIGMEEVFKRRGEKISLALIGRKLSEESKMKMRLAKLGKKQSPEAIAKRILCGDKHYNWQGGITNSSYPRAWTITLKRSIRERDNYSCRLCCKQQGEKAFSVHHTDADKNNCSPSNLITLCQTCHMKVHRGTAVLERPKG